MYCQKWYTEINNSSRLESYCLFKHDFKQGLERHLMIYVSKLEDTMI